MRGVRTPEPNAVSAWEPVRLAAGVMLTMAAVALQLVFVWHAGPLWRDEANSANLAALRSWWAIWDYSRYDSFPRLWNVLVWVLGQVGWTSDFHLRAVGLVAAWLQLAALWWAGRAVTGRAPLVALLLYGLAAPAVVYGTMFRGYGLGAAAFLLASGSLLRWMVAPTWRRAAWLAAANVIAVQSNFANGVLLAALHAAAALGLWRPGGRVPAPARAWAMVAAALGVATLSLGFSWSWIRYAFEVGVSEQRPVSLGVVAAVWWQSLGTQGWLRAALWCGAFLALGWLFGERLAGRVREERACMLAWACPLAVGLFLLYFWQFARLPSQEWHYLSLNAFVALAAEFAVQRLAYRRPMLDRAVAIGGVVLGLWLAWQAWPIVAVRMSNVDLIAGILRAQAAPQDLVVVAPWYCGISFQRYYHGPAPWITLPEVPDHRFHYHLAIRAKMALGDRGIEEERVRIVEALKRGSRVWLVGDLSAPPAGELPPSLPPAPHPVTGWRAGPYLEAWEQQIAALLRDHSREIWGIEVPRPTRINPWENLALTVIEGWQQGP
ncbi:MAG: hypothetical protein KatS3mg077_3199 [Candidatus Binatia bacterium]|nr:MAG: hypothetical protein KatS3mg077_3199 [Candidatus Binatia bacterium]